MFSTWFHICARPRWLRPWTLIWMTWIDFLLRPTWQLFIDGNRNGILTELFNEKSYLIERECYYYYYWVTEHIVQCYKVSLLVMCLRRPDVCLCRHDEARLYVDSWCCRCSFSSVLMCIFATRNPSQKRSSSRTKPACRRHIFLLY